MEQDLRDVIRDEYKRCAQDSVHFLKKYAVIQHPIKGKMNFQLFEFQEKALREFQSHRYNIVLKGRQLGLSTLVAGYALWKMIFHDDYKVLVIATTQDVAKELVSKVQLMYEKLPVWLKKTAQAGTFNKLELTFQNGSSIKAVSSSEKSARSPSISLLIVDEAAFIEKMEEIWTASQATLATGGDAILLSTPNGVGNKFHELWTHATEEFAEDGLDPFNPVKLSWRLHPDRNEEWARKELAKLGARKFGQEHDCDFISSGHTVIEGELLQWYKENQVQEPVEKRFGGNFWIWHYPDYTKSYILTADVARGDGGDYSAFHIFEVETMTQCAEYKGKIGTREYGNMLVSVATEWSDALLVIDNAGSGGGWDVIQVALDRGYKNLYYSHRNDPFLDENIQLRKNYDLREKKDMIPGMTITHKLRMNLISKLEIYFREKSLRVNSLRTVNELFVFMWINGKAQAQHGWNDDLVISLSMALFVRDTALRLRQVGIDLTKRALSRAHKTVYTAQTIQSDMWRQKIGGNRPDEDLTWLVR